VLRCSPIPRTSLSVLLVLLLLSAAPAAAQSRASWPERCRAMDAEDLVAQLADDGVRWNANGAREVIPGRLDQQFALGAGGPMARALLAALDSADGQQRDMAASLLMAHLGRWHREQGLWIWPRAEVDRVLAAAVDQLDGAALWWASYPVRSAYEFLQPHVVDAEEHLISALRDRRRGQRAFFAAVLLGEAGRSAWTHEIAPVLLPHLRHNHDRSDAILAMPALYRLGPAVMPALHQALPGADAQQRACLELLILDLQTPPRTPADFERRRRHNRITWKVADPAVTPADPYLLR